MMCFSLEFDKARFLMFWQTRDNHMWEYIPNIILHIYCILYANNSKIRPSLLYKVVNTPLANETFNFSCSIRILYIRLDVQSYIDVVYNIYVLRPPNTIQTTTWSSHAVTNITIIILSMPIVWHEYYRHRHGGW